MKTLLLLMLFGLICIADFKLVSGSLMYANNPSDGAVLLGYFGICLAVWVLVFAYRFLLSPIFKKEKKSETE
jgi:hypothetical protein